MVSNVIQREVLIDAPIERVWALLTEPDHVARWYASGGARVDLRPGGQLRVRWAEHGEFLGVIERVEPPRLFSFRLACEPDQVPAPGNATLVEFSLAPLGRETRLTLLETGFAELDISPEEQAAYADSEGQGWDSGLSSLRALAKDRVTT